MTEETLSKSGLKAEILPSEIARMPPGLHRTGRDELTIRRRRSGTGFSYVDRDGSVIRNPETLRRLKSLAVPPAYEEVLYAENPKAHLQAVGRDAAGRLQYRYHPDWEKVRERRKARRLVALVQALPRIRRNVTKHIAITEPTREFALATVIELVALTAIRPGSETYARAHGTRGAATLLKSNVIVRGGRITLTFRAKGGQTVYREIRNRRLAAALDILRQLPGRRLFQYRDEAGVVHLVRRRDVNQFLHVTAGVRISLKDFRTLVASTSVLEALAQIAPEKSERLRRRQILEAVRAAAEELANTPTVCRKSYVHDTIFAAFENGGLRRVSTKLKLCRSAGGREKVLAQIVGAACG